MYLRIELLSDTAFGRGDGVAGVVDNEIEHDVATGLPIIKGRTLKGLIVESCADLLYGLNAINPALHNRFDAIAQSLFGLPGSDLESTGIVHFHTATLPPDFVQWIKASRATRQEIQAAFTTIRRQTAVDPERDTPMDETLRATRVVNRGTVFHAPISADDQLSDEQIALLAACCATTRYAGLNRTRGLGHISIALEAVNEMGSHADWIAYFEILVRETVG